MIEIIATTIEDARRIEDGGGDRIELVSALTEGGLTPSYALIKNVIKNVKIPVNVMIRPHSKSFTYTKEEIELMKEDILTAKELKANGVVFGVINEEGLICEDSLEELLSVCDGLDVTFHKAIDETKNPIDGVKKLRKYPQITTVLTAGGKGSINDNVQVIKDMIKASGSINILAGGGLNHENVSFIIKKTGVTQLHFGTAVRDGKSPYGDINLYELTKLIAMIKENGGKS